MSKRGPEAPITPQKEKRQYILHETPERAAIRGAEQLRQYLISTGRLKNFNQRDLFDFFDIHRTTGQTILRSPTARLFGHNKDDKETRGRPSKISSKQVEKMVNWIKSHGWHGRLISWFRLGEICGLDMIPCSSDRDEPHEKLLTDQMIEDDVDDAEQSDDSLADIKKKRRVAKQSDPRISWRNVRRALQATGARKCVACQSLYILKLNRQARMKFYEEYHIKLPSFWYIVRFSDEVHFSFQPTRKKLVIRWGGERTHPDCIQYNHKPRRGDPQYGLTLHAWAAIWVHGRSKLIWYETPSSNGKMTKDVYLNQILNGPVKEWLDRGDEFVLEEDRDTGHGTSKKKAKKSGKFDCPVRQWKVDHKLRYYFNCSGSPDLAPIEMAWRALKQILKQRNMVNWNLEDLRKATEEAWEQVEQVRLDEYIIGQKTGMKKRLEKLKEANGGATGF